MSNIRGFGDFGGGQPRRPPPQGGPNQPGSENAFDGFGEPVQLQQLRFVEEHRVLLISGRKHVKNPQEENYWDMLTFALCPTFKFLSLTFLIILADVAIFIITVSIGLDSSSSYLLDVSGSTLLLFGANSRNEVKQGEVYRLVSAMFLHVYFMHLFGNVVTTFMFLSRVEYTYGVWKTLICYFVAGICGNIFSILVAPVGIKAGASTALYGIIGIIIGYIVINWNGLDNVGQALKCQIFCIAMMIIIFILIFTPADSSGIDYYGHLGGFLAGLWLSSIHETINQGKYEKIIRIVFASLLFAQIISCFLGFYLQS